MYFGQTPGAGTVQKKVSGPGATGRPKGRTTRPKPFFAPMRNAEQMPEFLKTANDLMSTYGTSELPAGLRPRWQQNKVNQAISKGMTKGV